MIARFVLGLGIGGDYPVSAVLMSEYSNRNDRGRLVGLVFSMQALGLIVGPLVALVLLSSGIGQRLDLAHPARSRRDSGRRGHLPAVQDARVTPLLAQVQGEHARAAGDLERFSEGVDCQARSSWLGLGAPGSSARSSRIRRMLKLLLGTAGAWFLFDYAYYGNTLSLPAILKEVDSDGNLGDQAAVVARHVRRLRRARLPAGRDEDGPDRSPTAAVHRLLRHGGVLPACWPLCRH